MPEPQSQEARFNRLYERHFDAVRAYAWRLSQPASWGVPPTSPEVPSMPAPDVLDTLRRHDPAAGLAPADADTRERLRRRNLDEDGFYGQQAALNDGSLAGHLHLVRVLERGRLGPARGGARRLRASQGDDAARRPGAREDEGGHHASSLRAYDAAIAEMKRGEPTLVRQHLRANC